MPILVKLLESPAILRAPPLKLCVVDDSQTPPSQIVDQ